MSTKDSRLGIGNPTVQTDKIDMMHGWRFTPKGNNYYAIRLSANECLALEVEKSSTKDGAALVINHYQEGNVNQLFRVDHIGNGFYTLTAKVSNKVIDVPGWSKKDQEKLMQYTANNGENQHWRIDQIV